MKKQGYIVVLVLTFVIEAVFCIGLLGKIEKSSQDTVAVNECLKSVEENFGNESLYIKSVDYVLIDDSGDVIYRTREGLSESINDAIRNSETILDITDGDEAIAKMIIHDDSYITIASYKTSLIRAILIISLVQIIIMVIFYLDIRKKILDPFANMEKFAARVAGGDLDVPLDIDRQRAFGSFSEAFDLMRTEIRSARASEKKANDDKKEMVAKLSHDIKTPVASIKSTSEIGYELASDPKIKEYFNLINVKSDQITVLVDNLFTSSVNDVTEIPVSPSKYDSNILYDLIRNSDHLKRVSSYEIPHCNIYADRLRLQQVLDNVFMNSYKYADTDIEVSATVDGDHLRVKIRDHGHGVKDEELPLLKNKYQRGENASSKDGAGLGLYLADYFMQNMEGMLLIDNEDDGLAVTLCIRTI